MSMPPISVQLWSIHKDVQNDFKGSLEAIAAMGFDAVEFAGDFGPYQDAPKQLRVFLDNLGLEISGAHVPIEKLRGRELASTVAFYKALGTPLLILPWDGRAYEDGEIEAFVEELNEIYDALEAHNMPFGFHNHSAEFDEYQGETYWDYIAQNTPDGFILQLDAGWATHAEKSPRALIERYAGRTQTIHVKAKIPKSMNDQLPVGKTLLLGQDVEDWSGVIRACLRKGGTKWIVLEQEDYPKGMSPLESVQASKQGLDKIISEL